MPKDPVDDYIELKKTAAQRRKEEDVNLLTQWQQQNTAGTVDPNLTGQLLSRFKPIQQNAINQYKSPLTGPGINTKARTLVLEGMKSWDPARGGAPSTHITNQLRRLYRENLQQQSVQNTEADAGLFGGMDTASAELTDELGRDPTNQELHTRVNEALPAHRKVDLGRMEQAQSRRRKTVSASNFESNPQTMHQQLEQQKLEMLPHDLDEQETQVYNNLFGKGGARASTSTNTIARRMGVSAPTISRLRKRILTKAGVTEDQLAATRKPRKPRKPKGQ